MAPELTTRAYTVKLAGDNSGNGAGDDNWRQSLWDTHRLVNQAAQTWGDWLLTLRGGLPKSLAGDDPGRRVLLALSWLSVESPVSLCPRAYLVTDPNDCAADRERKIVERFAAILDRMQIPDSERSDWIAACEPALRARIRDGAVWVDRSQAFIELQTQFPGLTVDWAAATILDFLGGPDAYFLMPDSEQPALAEPKNFVQKANGWLSPYWGAGPKSVPSAIGEKLLTLSQVEPSSLIGRSGQEAIGILLESIGEPPPPARATARSEFKRIKSACGWIGRSSKGALALEKVHDCASLTSELWQYVANKLSQEAQEKSGRQAPGSDHPAWMAIWRPAFERRLGFPYRTSKDLLWQHVVALDHALRRVSSAHTWIKRAEAERKEFKADAQKISEIPPAARQWLDAFRDARSTDSGALGEYIIRRRAIDGWDKIVDAWHSLGAASTREQRIAAARESQRNLADDEKFGDIQLFAGFGDAPNDSARPCLADDDAQCVWRDGGAASPHILKDYVAATVADHNQRRFKVPSYRHPDPLLHPIFVDYGKSRWGIEYSALKASKRREKLQARIIAAKTDKSRATLKQQLDACSNDTHRVELEVWHGDKVRMLPLRWTGARFSRDAGLDRPAGESAGIAVTRADRMGRLAAGQLPGAQVSISAIFEQEKWNGRLQAPRVELNRLAKAIYGKGRDPDLARLSVELMDAPAKKLWNRLRWFLTISPKLSPQGPWLDYVRQGLPPGAEYKKGRNGYYLHYAANKDRKKPAMLRCARLPHVRVLSLDLGHRFAAACAVWETISREEMSAACRAAGRAEPSDADLYIHLRRQTDTIQRAGRPQERPTEQTVIYRRVGADLLPDGSPHPAPWAQLERQFVVRLQGEDRSARKPLPQELDAVNSLRELAGLSTLGAGWRIDELHSEAIAAARIGMRRLGDMARVAYALTAREKPIAGGRSVELSTDERVNYIEDALVRWRSAMGHDAWAAREWQASIPAEFDDLPPPPIDDDLSRAERKQAETAARPKLRAVARWLVEHSDAAENIRQRWRQYWEHQESTWRRQLRTLRTLILPRAKDWKSNPDAVRQVGGLSVKRLATIRGLYETLKAFRMRPHPDDLRKYVPALDDDSLAEFGKRILDRLEKLREQRIKQLASRVVEAALGAGRMPRPRDRDLPRPVRRVDEPCHVVVVENLADYRPEESRFRRENRRLMEWAARNVRKYILEGCELHGLLFMEVSPKYTSRQDSRTGAPGIRCEDVPCDVLRLAISSIGQHDAAAPVKPDTKQARAMRRWARAIRRIHDKRPAELNSRESVVASFGPWLNKMPAAATTIRLPLRGGDLFVSANIERNSLRAIQADLNAAANIGLRAIMDPDWRGAWWYVLADLETRAPFADYVKGSAAWAPGELLDAPQPSPDEPAPRPRSRAARRAKTNAYLWNPLFSPAAAPGAWTFSQAYWEAVERRVAEQLGCDPAEAENPF